MTTLEVCQHKISDPTVEQKVEGSLHTVFVCTKNVSKEF
jgi:hypothetical protein